MPTIRPILKCIICQKEYKDSHYRGTSKCCSRQCRVEYNSLYSKSGYLQVNKEGLLLCHMCLKYKYENKFSIVSNLNKVAKSRKERNTICRDCQNIRNIKYMDRLSDDLISTLKIRINSSKGSAKVRDIDFNITLEDLIEKYNNQNGRCALSGEILELRNDRNYRKKYSLKRLSIDRIDSNKGYTKDNIQLVCWAANQLKFDLTEQELYYWCNAIINNKIIKDAQSKD